MKRRDFLSVSAGAVAAAGLGIKAVPSTTDLVGLPAANDCLDVAPHTGLTLGEVTARWLRRRQPEVVAQINRNNALLASMRGRL